MRDRRVTYLAVQDSEATFQDCPILRAAPFSICFVVEINRPDRSRVHFPFPVPPFQSTCACFAALTWYASIAKGGIVCIN
jgi:hypothetical protein